MKEKLKEEFIPSRSRLFKELFYLHQGDLSVTEYKLKFEELVFECGFQMNHLSTTYICMFYNGLTLDFKKKFDLTYHEICQRDIFWL